MRVPFASILGVVGLLAVACNNTNSVQLNPLPAPSDLESVSLNQAIDLFWADNPAVSGGNRFYWYQVYSASYDLDHGTCGATWYLEGATVAPEFLAGSLTNGVPRCYGVSAISTDGAESARSPLRQDTPRPDARNVLVYAFGTNPGASGFRFWDDVNNDGTAQSSELGLIQSGSGSDIDFVVDRNNTDSSVWIIPVYTGTQMQVYGSVADLTSIDFAPATGYSADSAKAQVGFGYVFQIMDGTVLHYGALRVTHVGRQYIVFDWSVQTDPGNPELEVLGGRVAAKPTGAIVVAP